MKEFTKHAISDAFISLLQTQTIEKITVKTIAETCGINRQTFYYHFADIYELMAWSLDSELKKFTAENNLMDSDWQERLKQMLFFLRSHRRILLNAYNAQNRLYYELFMYRNFFPAIKAHLLTLKEAETVPEEKIDFVAKVFTRVLLNFILDWLDEGMPDQEKIEIEDYVAILNGTFHNALTVFQTT